MKCRMFSRTMNDISWNDKSHADKLGASKSTRGRVLDAWPIPDLKIIMDISAQQDVVCIMCLGERYQGIF